MKKYFIFLAVTLLSFKSFAQTINNGFYLGPISGYYTDLGLNTTWNGGWKYISNGPCLLLRLGDWNSASDFIFQTAPVGTLGGGTSAPLKEVMRICENGNVGIGTSIPGNYKLAVEGTVGARSIKVKMDSWADFVFDPAYKLPDLKEIETHVKFYNRLPGIPSAREIAQEGLDLGEMQKKQMQKIEELTLYLIEINKKLESQQQLIAEQRDEIMELKKHQTK